MLKTKHVLMLKEFVEDTRFTWNSYSLLEEYLDIDNGKEIFKNVYKIFHAYERLRNCGYNDMFYDIDYFDLEDESLNKIYTLYGIIRDYYIENILDLIITKKYFPGEEPYDILFIFKTIKDCIPKIKKSVDHSNWKDWHVLLNDEFKEALDELIDGIVALEKELPE